MENEDYICEQCEAEFSLIFDNEVGKPEYCPFCGNSLEEDDDAYWPDSDVIDED